MNQEVEDNVPATENPNQAKPLQIENWALSAFAGAVMAISKAETLPTLLRSICAAITTDTPFMLAWIGFANEDEAKTVTVIGSAGEAESYLNGVTISWDANSPLGHGPTGVCLRDQTVQILADSTIDDHFSPWLEKASQYGLRSSLSVPLKHPEGRAALMIYSREVNAFSDHVLPVFKSLAVEVANGIEKLSLSQKLAQERAEHSASQKQLDEALYQTIRALSLTLESRDPYTAGHEERVAKIACSIANQLGWDAFRIPGLRLAAMVHDIGKIAVPSEILTKPSRLSAAEMALVREHPETGYRTKRHSLSVAYRAYRTRTS